MSHRGEGRLKAFDQGLIKQSHGSLQIKAKELGPLDAQSLQL